MNKQEKQEFNFWLRLPQTKQFIKNLEDRKERIINDLVTFNKDKSLKHYCYLTGMHNVVTSLLNNELTEQEIKQDEDAESL